MVSGSPYLRIEGETTSFGLRNVVNGGLKMDQLKRGDLFLRAKDHFKGGPKTVDKTMTRVHQNHWGLYICVQGAGIIQESNKGHCLGCFLSVFFRPLKNVLAHMFFYVNYS